jgi:septal ring factor EnvC (AmiA/AmiB activator)
LLLYSSNLNLGVPNNLAINKQGREALERQVQDLETELKGTHKVRRGAERALAEADATIDTLRRDMSRLEEENTAMVL